MTPEQYKARHKDFSIELDCPPGSPRPFDLIEGVLKGSGLEVRDFDTGTPFFGHQTWVLKNFCKDALFIAHKSLFEERITRLYHAGLIRFGSW